MNSPSIPCPYCGSVGYHVWAGGGGCPGAASERERDAVASAVIRALTTEVVNLKEAIERLVASNQLLQETIDHLHAKAVPYDDQSRT